jgi:hypothetical protein
MYKRFVDLWGTVYGKLGVPTMILAIIDWSARFQFTEDVLSYVLGKNATLKIVSSPWTSPLLVICGLILIWTNYKKLGDKPSESTTPNITNRKSHWRAVLLVVFCTALVALTIWNVHLQNDLNYTRRDVSHLKAEMIRYVLPRQLTEQQIKDFGTYLAVHSSKPQQITVRWVSGEVESQRYANDFMSAFQAAGWIASASPIYDEWTCQPAASKNMPPIECTDPVQNFMGKREDIECSVVGPALPDLADTVEEKIRSKTPLSGIINDSFKAAHIPVSCGGSGRQNDPSDTLNITMFVGRRPRDKYGILPPGWSDFTDKVERMKNLSDDDY